MISYEIYNLKKRWFYPSQLIEEIMLEIKQFYVHYNKDKKKNEQIIKFINEPAFEPLRQYVISNNKAYDSDIPSKRWLRDFYNGDKKDHQLTKACFESLIMTFNYSYDPVKNEFWKRTNKVSSNVDLLIERQKIIKYIISKSRNQIGIINDFIGIYKYFVGGRKEDTRYDFIYENELEIYENGEIEVRNPFNGHNYLGFATIKDDSCLQLISYDFDGGLIDGIGNLLSFKINKYAKKVILIPGLSSSFDADGGIIFAQALLSSDLTLNKQSNIIREYFEELIMGLRLYSPGLKDVEKLVNNHYVN